MCVAFSLDARQACDEFPGTATGRQLHVVPNNKPKKPSSCRRRKKTNTNQTTTPPLTNRTGPKSFELCEARRKEADPTDATPQVLHIHEPNDDLNSSSLRSEEKRSRTTPQTRAKLTTISARTNHRPQLNSKARSKITRVTRHTGGTLTNRGTDDASPRIYYLYYPNQSIMPS